MTNDTTLETGNDALEKSYDSTPSLPDTNMQDDADGNSDAPIIDYSVKSIKLKDEGNSALAAYRFNEAVRLYSEAISYDATNAIFYSNRAMAYIKMESYGLAIIDATKAIELDPKYVKGYYRRGSALFALGKNKQARKDFRSVCQQRPRDRDARNKLGACDKAVKEAAFSAAIESSETEPLSSTINVENIKIEPSYDGPRVVPVGASESEEGAEESGYFRMGMLPMDFVMASIERFRNQKLIHRRYVTRLLIVLKSYFKSLPSLVDLSIPDQAPDSSSEPHITVCGDTHGQFYDVLNIFEINGYPSSTNPYLFNGDFVDRGSFSVEVILTYFLLKMACPDGINLHRGNHETKNMNKIYGFEGEVKHKYDNTIFELFLEVFQELPLASVIGGKVFVTHGGIPSEGTTTLSNIRDIPRGREPGESGLMSDLLWSDPQPFPGKAPSKRGVGFAFGPDITADFLERNGLELLVRSHEVKDEGYLVEHGGKTITVFSAPNYCDSMGNKGALIHFGKDCVPKFIQFDAVSHPEVRPMAYAAGMSGFFQ